MPATTPKETPSKGPSVRYVRCELNAEQKAHLKSWADAAEWVDLASWVDVMVSRGHTVSIKGLDVGFQVAVTGVRAGSGHDGMCLVARASSPMKALFAAWYRDEVVLAGVWPVDSSVENLDF